MFVVRLIGMILLAVYLFFSGLFELTKMNVTPMFSSMIGLVAMGAGVLILISLGKGSER